MGALIFVLGVSLTVFVAWNCGHVWYRHGVGLGLIVGFGFGTLIGVFITWVGWRFIHRWDRAVVADFADVQAWLTGMAVGKIAGLHWEHATAISIGFVSFLLIRGWLRRIILDVVGMPDGHARAQVEKAMLSDVAGTPWQHNPNYTR